MSQVFSSAEQKTEIDKWHTDDLECEDGQRTQFNWIQPVGLASFSAVASPLRLQLLIESQRWQEDRDSTSPDITQVPTICNLA
jgi:hypothetical protein